MLQRPGDDGYIAATRPRNATAQQRPVAVVAATNANDVRSAVRVAAKAGLAVAVQATGHGAAGRIDDDVLLIDTCRLDTITADLSARIARVGAGATWAALNAAAERHGLLGLAGTAPDVSVVGYTMFGGIRWLTRPYGVASASFRRVEFVDGNGQASVADADQNPYALWAFRGAGGVGIVTAVEIDLVSVDDLWAGYQLWPIGQAESIVTAWVAALDAIDDSLTSAIGFLTAPDVPTVPTDLRGHRVVHLSAASIRGAAGFAPLQDALKAAPLPAIDTVGPCDAPRLARIHIDPAAPVLAVGEGRWLTAAAPHVYELTQICVISNMCVGSTTCLPMRSSRSPITWAASTPAATPIRRWSAACSATWRSATRPTRPSVSWLRLCWPVAARSPGR